MRIDSIECSYHRLPLKKSISNSIYTYSDYQIAIARIRTNEGIEGFGWVKGGKIVYDYLEEMKQVIEGEDPSNVERIWSKLYRPKIWGRKGLATRALSCIDIALWDIKAKLSNKPLYQFLGGYRDWAPVYIAGGYYEEDKGIGGLLEEMHKNISMGVKALKMKVGRVSVRKDAELVRAVRESVGPDILLMVDANNAYRPSEAKKLAEAIAEYDIFWFEEPVHPDDLPGLQKLAASSRIPIATGENEYTVWGFREMITSGAVDIVNADAQVGGGITDWMKIAHLADAFNVSIAPHGHQELHVHLVCAVPNGLIIEYYRDNVNPFLGEGNMFTEGLKIKDGMIYAPQKSGIGLELNWEFLNNCRQS